MKPTTELFDLIKSLSRSEKRYFKLNASKQKGSKNYIRLFAAIDSMDEYDESLLKKNYSKENFSRNLTFNKNYLNKLIFKSLISYTEEKTIDSKLYNILNRCKFLFAKSLFKQYFKTVQYGKVIAVKYERFTYLLEFLELERQLSRKEDLNRQNIQSVYDEEEATLEKLREINAYKRIVSYLFKVYWTFGVVRDKETDEKVNSLISGEKFVNEKRPKSLIAKERYYFALYLAHEVKGNASESFMYNSKRLDLISSNKEIFQKFIFDNYEETFLSLINSAINAGKFASAKALFEKYKRSFGKKNEVDSLTTLYMLRLKEKIFTGDTVDQKFISELDDVLVKYKGKLNIDSYNNFYFDLARFFLMKGKFVESLNYINILFESRYLKHTPSLVPYTRMLNVVIHSELGNFKLLSHLIPATEKYLKSKNKYYKTEAAVLKFLNENLKGKKDKAFSELKKQLQIVLKKKYEKNCVRYFDYLKWIEDKNQILLK